MSTASMSPHSKAATRSKRRPRSSVARSPDCCESGTILPRRSSGARHPQVLRGRRHVTRARGYAPQNRSPDELKPSSTHKGRPGAARVRLGTTRRTIVRSRVNATPVHRHRARQVLPPGSRSTHHRIIELRTPGRPTQARHLLAGSSLASPISRRGCRRLG